MHFCYTQINYFEDYDYTKIQLELLYMKKITNNYKKNISSINLISNIFILLLIIIGFSACVKNTNVPEESFEITTNSSSNGETTDNNVPLQQTANNQDNTNSKSSGKLDWFAAYMLNPDKDYAHFFIAGYNERNTVMYAPEKYKKNKTVQKMFTDNTGKFDEELFQQKYKEAYETYKVFMSGDIQDKYMRKYKGTIYNPNAEEIENPSIKVEVDL